MKFKYILIASTVVFSFGCSSFNQVINEVDKQLSQTSTVPTESEIGSGLKDALIKGTNEGVNNLSQTGGYLNNAAVKIPFPKEYERVETALRNIGLGNEVDKVVTSLNRAAEDAVKEAAPLFVNAIKSMTIQDAKNILFGADNSATEYLKSKTTAALVAAFEPKIKASLDKVNATKYWNDIASTYNKLPLVTPVNADLTNYVTEKAMQGLFMKIAEEEKDIRANPVERTTAILKRVFGYADSQGK